MNSVIESINNKVSEIIHTDLTNFDWIDIVCNAEKLKIEDNSFDYVLFLRVLHHIEDYKKALEEALRVLKPWGKILFSEPHPYFVKLQDLLKLWNHPDKTIWRKDIIEFSNSKKLELEELGKLFLFYFWYKITNDKF